MTLSTAVTYLDALVAALAADAPLTALAAVYDGQPVTSDPSDYFAVGYQLDDPDTQATSQGSWATLSRTLEATYTIPCLARAYRGDTDHTATRTAAMGIVTAAWAVLLPAGSRPNATALGLADVLWARMELTGLRTVKDDSGSTVFAAVDLHVREYVQSV